MRPTILVAVALIASALQCVPLSAEVFQGSLPPLTQLRKWILDKKNVHLFRAVKGDEIEIEITSKDFRTKFDVYSVVRERWLYAETGLGDDWTTSRLFFTASTTGLYEIHVGRSSTRDNAFHQNVQYRVELNIRSNSGAVDRFAPEQKVYVAIATTIPKGAAGSRPLANWSYWTAWAQDSTYDAQLLAEEKCRSERSSSSDPCTVEVSMRGACVALVEGFWFQALAGSSSQQLDRHHAGFLATSTFGEEVMESALRDCSGSIRSGTSDPPAYRCVPIVRYCSGEHQGANH